MQNRQLEEKVDDLLRLALLQEHGGLLLKVAETLLTEDIGWLQNHLQLKDILTENGSVVGGKSWN